jgi:hypothetical protein
MIDAWVQIRNIVKSENPEFSIILIGYIKQKECFHVFKNLNFLKRLTTCTHVDDKAKSISQQEVGA